MKITPYINKLSSSNEYKEFQKKNNDSFMVAGFFVIDLDTGQKMHQIDYYIPSKNKIAAFTLDKSITMQMLDLLGTKAPKKLDSKINIDLEALPGILEDEMKNRSITEEIKKIIAVVQNVDGRIMWNLNCILSGMSILNAHIEDDSGSILKMEKKSLTDIMRTIPAGEIMQAKNIQPQTQAEAEQKVDEAKEEHPKQNENAPAKESEKEDAKEKIRKLEVLELAIKKEKAMLLKNSKEKSSTKK